MLGYRFMGLAGLAFVVSLAGCKDTPVRPMNADAGDASTSVPDAGLDAADSDADAGAADAADLVDAGSDDDAGDDASVPVRTLGCADPTDCKWRAATPFGGFGCAVREDGALWCWGDEKKAAPMEFANRRFESLAASRGGACMLDDRGGMWCFDAGRFVPVDAPQMTQLAISSPYACGIVEDGEVVCWEVDEDAFPSGPVETGSLEGPAGLGPRSLAVDSRQACLIAEDDGALWCWDIRDPEGSLRETAPGIAMTDVRMGAFGTCGVADDKRLLCRLAGETEFAEPAPDREFESVAVAYDYACAVATDDTLWCWGANGSGQLGTGDTEDRPTPTQVAGYRRWVSVGTTGWVTCAIDTDAHVWCWGDNYEGALGVPVAPLVHEARTLLPGTSFVDVSLTEEGGCAVADTGELWCWGIEWAAAPEGMDRFPKRVGGSNWTRVWVGAEISCGLRGQSKLWCWGHNEAGQIDPAQLDQSVVRTPTLMMGSIGVQMAAPWGRSVCAIDNGDRLWCWGENRAGLFGEANAPSSQAPLAVWPERRFRQVAFDSEKVMAVDTAGDLITWNASNVQTLQRNVQRVATHGVPYCAITAEGTASCGGDDAYAEAARALAAETPVQDVSVSTDTACAVGGEGALWCWGQLREVNGSYTFVATPEAVLTDARLTRVDLNDHGGCVLDDEGELRCWGWELDAQGYGRDSVVPLRVALP